MACIQNDSAWFDIIFRIQYNIKKTGGLIIDVYKRQLIKCPEWRGYWKWEDNSIKMHCKDGKTLDIRETKNVGYTLDFILRDDWEIVDEADVKDLDVQTFTFGEAIRRLKIGQKVEMCIRDRGNSGYNTR